MTTRRRLALLAGLLPIAAVVYACSSDSTDGAATPEEEAGTESGPNPDIDSSTPGQDSSLPDTSTNPDTGADGGDSGTGACVGNPLTADGGTTDGGVNLDAAVSTRIVTANVNDFLDGPHWIDVAGGGFLVYSEYEPAGTLRRVAADGGGAAALRSTFPAASGPVGNAVRNGLIISAVDGKTAGGTPSLTLTATDGGAAGTLPLGATSTSPNDLVTGPTNNAYFTDGQYQNAAGAGTAGVYRLFSDGGVGPVQVGFGRANGIAISPDNTKLYVGVGPLGGDPDPKAVLVYTVAPNGNVTTPGVSFLTAADLVDVPDGMAVDVAGNLWVAEANATFATLDGRVEVFSPTKKKLGSIPFPGHRPTGVAFGGADNKTLFITTTTGVWRYQSRCAGVR